MASRARAQRLASITYPVRAECNPLRAADAYRASRLREPSKAGFTWLQGGSTRSHPALTRWHGRRSGSEIQATRSNAASAGRPPHSVPGARSRRARCASTRRARCAIVACVLATLWLSAPAMAQTDPGTVDANFARVSIVVWGNGTQFSEFHVDANQGDSLNISVVMQLSRNELTSEIPITLRAFFLQASLANATDDVTIVVGPDSPRRITLPALNLTLPRDVAEGTYRMRMELDAGDAESFPVSNQIETNVEVGIRIVDVEPYALRPGFLIGAGLLVLAAVGAWAWTRRLQTAGGRRARSRYEDRVAILVEKWAHHPHRARFKVLLTVGSVALIVLFLAVSGYLQVPTRTVLLRRLVIGVMIGAIYALVAVGYTMVYGVLKFINFAHGEIFMWGAYAAFFVAVQFGQPFFVGVLGAVLFAAALGATVERVAYRPLRKAARLTPLITAIGVSLFLQGTAQFFFTPNKQVYTESLARTHIWGQSLEHWLEATVVTVFGVPIQAIGVLILVTSVVMMVGLHLFIKYSRLGKAMRAVSDDFDTASIIGIQVDRVILTTFVIGSAMAAIAGILFGLRFSVYPTMGFVPGIKAFTAAVVGGIGSVYGAFLGGFIIGLAENVGGAYLVEPAFQEAIGFLILIIFLIVRPTGIIAARESEVRSK